MLKMIDKYYWLYAVLSLSLLAAYLLGNPTPAVLERDTITRESMFWINMTAAIPAIVIWLIGFYSFIKLRQYTRSIQHDPDGRAFHFLSAGIGTLVIGSSTHLVITRWLLNAHDAGFVAEAFLPIFATHFIVSIVLTGFALIAYGAHLLHLSVGAPTVALWRKTSGVMSLAIVATLFTMAVFSNPSREYPTAPGNFSYFTPDWVTFTTFVIPFIAAMACGVIAVTLTAVYAHAVRGSIYRKAFQKLNYGITLITAAFTLILSTDVMANSIVAQGIELYLLFLYISLATFIAGSACIAWGAKSLAKLEESSES